MSHAEYIMLRNIKVVDLWRMQPQQVAAFAQTCSGRLRATIELAMLRRKISAERLVPMRCRSTVSK
ncbi:hypothetical protein ALQ95_200191 [Pseudomonas syringae pv. ribicola]|uniref:Uncharacterized protein n=1 Tax=Pseudomonas syringae pv. ribicola TaxID=55398 RepID=A0A3M2VMP1_PSESI|nr:hypothetical protein ALQ95_200191 [Pseudomonas syringae pv. ribicola]